MNELPDQSRLGGGAEGRWHGVASAGPIVLAGLTGGLVLAAGPAWAAIVAAAGVLAGSFVASRTGASRRRLDADRDRATDRLTAASLAAAVPDPLIVFDATGSVVIANEPARAAFGPLAAGAPLQLRFRAPEMQQLFQAVLSGQARSAAADYAEKVPIERLYRASVSPIGADTGLFVLGFRDQSEARRIDRMRADFIANASHELRTPLASVSGFIETLRGPARDDAGARERFLQIMQNQTARMARLIDDLLSLSRLEMKPFASPDDRVDLAKVLNGVVDAMKHLAEETGIAVERRFAVEAAPVAGLEDELFQVFENLLENACKYGQSGGRVIVGLDRDSVETRVTVKDFGPGIAPEHIPRITERFYRVDVESSRAQKGTGLGLSIVKHILTRHKAWLTIRSDVGRGAEFIVHFPNPT